MSKPDIWATGEVNPDYPEWAEKRIAELEAEKSKAWETCQLAVERGMKLEVTIARLRGALATLYKRFHQREPTPRGEVNAAWSLIKEKNDG